LRWHRPTGRRRGERTRACSRPVSPLGTSDRGAVATPFRGPCR